MTTPTTPTPMPYMYGDLYVHLTEEQKNEYLKRIGITETDFPVTEETLDKLVYAHLCTVPFESLTLFEFGGNIDIGIPALYEKIVVNRRGGYCFELNGLFMELLRAIGFEVAAVPCRVLMGREPKNFNPIAHRASIVTIDGKRYFCDVGFGGPAPGGSLRVDEPHVRKTQFDDTYYLREYGDNAMIVMRETPDADLPMLLFYLTPQELVDFVAFNNNVSSSPTSRFRSRRTLNLRRPDGNISIDGFVFKQHKNGVYTERVLKTEEEILEVYKTEFGLSIEGPLNMAPQD